MKTFKFADLANKYERFQYPKAIIEVNGKSLASEKKGFPVSDIMIDLTSGFEASIAEFSIYDTFDPATRSFRYDSVKKYILLGSEVEVYLGYGPTVRSVFVGAITRVNFLFEEEGTPCIRVTAMDVKGIMMSSCYSKQLSSLYYSDAVTEILEKTAYEKLKSSNIIRDIKITETADKQRGATGGSALGGIGGGATSSLSGAQSALSGATTSISDASGGLTDSLSRTVSSTTGSVTESATNATGTNSLTDAVSGTTSSASSLTSAATDSSATVTDRSLEMVAESDYEFVVKAAKKNNYEFFTECGIIYFRKARSNTQILISIGPDRGLRSFDISYDTTGIAEKVIARGTDAGKGQVISANQKFTGKMSYGNKAKKLIKGSQKVFLDASITSSEEAAERAQYLTETMSYRLGSLKCNMVGLPELLPGYFVKMKGLGTAADNIFYIDRVRHIMDIDGSYITELTGRASSIETTM